MKELVIYQTTDTHGFILDTDFVNRKKWGLARVSSFVKEDQKKYEHQLLIDTGDVIQGSPMTHYLSQQAKWPHPIIEVFNKMNYDCFTFGNHEFNFGKEYLEKSLITFNNDIICANVHGLDLNINPYKIYEYENTKIAIIGLTTSYIPMWEKEENIKGLTFENPVDVYRKYEKELQEKADLIIVNYHGGFEKDLETHLKLTEEDTKENQGSELLNEFDSIDILLTGHQHRGVVGKFNKTILTQPANNGSNIAKLVVDLNNKKVVSYELIDMQEIEIENDQEVVDIINDTQEEVDTYLDKVICHLDQDILIDDIFKARLNGHPMINLLHEIQLKETGADISTVSIFDTALGFSKDITIRQVLMNYPFPNTLNVIELEGKKIIEAIEKSYEYFVLDDGIKVNPKYLEPKPQHYNFDLFYGLNYTVDLSKNFSQRITKHNLDLEKKYKLVLNNYRFSNIGIFPMYKGAKLISKTDKDMIEITIKFLEEIGEKKIKKENNITIKK